MYLLGLKVRRQDFHQPVVKPYFPCHPRPNGKGEVQCIRIALGLNEFVALGNSLAVKKAKAIDPFSLRIGFLGAQCFHESDSCNVPLNASIRFSPYAAYGRYGSKAVMTRIG